MSDLYTFGLVALSAVFFVVDPIMVVPIFLGMTARDTHEQRQRMATRASLASGLTLTIFALAGKLIFRAFGISLGAFKIAGGALLFLMALDMMQARPSRVRTTPEEEREGAEKEDVAIIPLAIPLLSGPGAIATVMVLMSRHRQWAYSAMVFIAIGITTAATWAVLRSASWMQRRISATFLNVTSRVMGLILAAVAVEFLVTGIKDVLPTIAAALNSPPA